MGWISISPAGTRMSDAVADLLINSGKDQFADDETSIVTIEKPIPEGIVNDKGEPIHGHSSNDR